MCITQCLHEEKDSGTLPKEVKANSRRLIEDGYINIKHLEETCYLKHLQPFQIQSDKHPQIRNEPHDFKPPNRSAATVFRLVLESYTTRHDALYFHKTLRSTKVSEMSLKSS